MKLSRKKLRALIREEIGRNFHTLETNPPFTFENVPGKTRMDFVLVHPPMKIASHCANFAIEKIKFE